MELIKQPEAMTSPIWFTQYMMPDGRREPVQILRPDDIAKKAAFIQSKGYTFECEMLSDMRTISLTITDDEGDFDIEVVPNGPEIPIAVDRLITRAAERLS
jgi:hypothetical protein